jgi:DNA-binding beta-propeller fold protein YncE
MKRFLTIGLVAAAALVAVAAFAAEGYHPLGTIQIGGAGGWDYLTMDSDGRRLYVSHGNSVEVVDVDAGKKVGEIPDTRGVHGIAIASDLNKGFTSNGRANSVTIFDLKTLQKIGEAKTGANPDAICFEPKTQRVFTFNGGSKNTTAIDAKSGEVVGTAPVGGKPEFCVADGAGKLYVNIESTSEVVEIDAAKPAVTRRASVAPCDGPSGLAIDTKGRKLFSVCGNKLMAVTDADSMKMIGTLAIGQGPDAAGFDPELGLAFSPNGRDGTLTIVKLVDGKYQPVDTVTTEKGARTMAVDEKLHRVYLSAGGGSFHIVQVGK